MQTLTHPADVDSLSFNPDKTKLVTGAADNLARIWDVATGQELQFFAHAGAVRGVAFHNNNTTIVTGSVDKSVMVHVLAATRVIVTGSPVRGLTLTPNASHILTAGADKSVKLLNIGNGANERTFAGAEEGVNAVAVSRNNVLVAAGGIDKIVRVYNFADGKQIGAFKTAAAIRGLAFTANNLTLAAAGDNGAIAAWNVTYNPGQPIPPEFGKPLQSFTHAASATSLAFAADNFTVYSGSLDKTAKAWKLASEIPTKNFAHPNYVDAVAFNQAGTQLATGCHDGTVRIWDIAKGQQLRQINAHVQPQPAPVYCVAWTADAKQIISGSLDKTLKLWDATSGNLVREFKAYKEKDFEKGHRDGVFCVAFSPDGKQIASGSSDRTLKLWDVAKGTVEREFINPTLKAPVAGDSPPAHPGWIYGLRFTTDGKRIVSAGNAPRNHGYLAVWNVADGKMLSGEELALGSFNNLALSPDGKLVGLACSPQGKQPQDVSSYLYKMPEPK